MIQKLLNDNLFLTEPQLELLAADLTAYAPHLKNRSLPQLPQIHARELGEKDFDSLFVLHKGNTYYNACLHSGEVTKEQVLAGLTQLPAGTSQNQKHYLGLFFGQTLLGCIDFVEGYPNQQTVFLGLLMIDSNLQSRGLGGLVANALEVSARQAGFSAVRLGCLLCNHKASRFWLGRDFLPHGTSGKIIVMQKSL